MFVLITILLACMVINVFTVRGRTGQPGLTELKDWSYAHRGLHDAQKPENSLAAFRAALQRGYGVELDIHLLKDGTLAVMHDSDLKRTTGQEGTLENLTLDDLKNYSLGGTQEMIPTFREALDLFAGKVPLIIELKTHGRNADRLTEAACKMLEGYQGLYCIESFDPRCIRYLRKHHPSIIRGQLAENALKRDKTYGWLTRFITTYYLENFLTRPDFIAYRFEDRETTSNALCRKLWGIQGFSWTIRSPQDFATAKEEGWIPIFEGFDPKDLGLE